MKKRLQIFFDKQAHRRVTRRIPKPFYENGAAAVLGFIAIADAIGVEDDLDAARIAEVTAEIIRRVGAIALDKTDGDILDSTQPAGLAS